MIFRNFEIENVNNEDMKVEILRFNPDNNQVDYRVIVRYDARNGLNEIGAQVSFCSIDHECC